MKLYLIYGFLIENLVTIRNKKKTNVLIFTAECFLFIEFDSKKIIYEIVLVRNECCFLLAAAQNIIACCFAEKIVLAYYVLVGLMLAIIEL